MNITKNVWVLRVPLLCPLSSLDQRNIFKKRQKWDQTFHDRSCLKIAAEGFSTGHNILDYMSKETLCALVKCNSVGKTHKVKAAGTTWHCPPEWQLFDVSQKFKTQPAEHQISLHSFTKRPPFIIPPAGAYSETNIHIKTPDCLSQECDHSSCSPWHTIITRDSHNTGEACFTALVEAEWKYTEKVPWGKNFAIDALKYHSDYSLDEG